VRIRVEGFQIIRKAEIVVDGITVVRGASNAGKTAMMRAVRALIENRRGDDFIHWDCDEAVVEVDNGEVSIEWHKPRGSGGYYVVDGERELRNVGHGPPEEVELLGLSPVETRRDSLWLNLWRQRTLFLVDRPGTRMFDALSEMMSDRDVTPVLSNLKRDAKTASDEAKAASGALEAEKEEVRSLEERAEGLAPASDLCGEAVDLLETAQGAEEILGLAGQVSEVRSRIDSTDEELSRVRTASRGLRKAIEWASERLDSASEMLDSAAALEVAAAVDVTGELEAVSGLLEEAPDPDSLEADVGSAEDIWRSSEELEEALSVDVAGELEALDAFVTSLPDPGELTEGVDFAEAASGAAGRLDGAKESREIVLFDLERTAQEKGELETETGEREEELESLLGTCEECGAPTIDGTYVPGIGGVDG
jgi:hypothetical protein